MDMYDRIDAALKRKHLSRRALSSLADVPYGTLMSAYRRKSKSFSMEYINRISAVLEMTTDELLYGDIPLTGGRVNGEKVHSMTIKAKPEKRFVTLAEYSRTTGLSIPTIKHGIATGQIRAVTTEAGQYRVDTQPDANKEITAINEKLDALTEKVQRLCLHLGVK